MKHRVVSVTVLIATLLLSTSLMPATAMQPEGPALVRIAWQGPDDLAHVEAVGAPIYARLTAHGEWYLLAGAASREIEVLQAQGLDVRLLDPDIRGATYYLAYPMPGQLLPDWDAYGRLLLDDGVQVLLRTTSQDAERLAEAGVELRAVSLTPKPLRPAQVEGAFPAVIEPNPLIQNMIDQVSSTDVYSYTGDLSGEWPVEIGGSPYTIATRHTTSGVPIQKATQLAYEHLESLGLTMEYHDWSRYGYSGRNVIGELTGLTNPEDIFIICGHIDDMPSGPVAPGADDNASGSVAVLLAADILTQYQWGCTLRFALWTGEEQGLIGSEVYAERSYYAGENIVGVLNLDMIAWDDIAGPDMDLHADQTGVPPSMELAQLFADVVDAYNLNLIPHIIPNGLGASDHASFWDFGYTAILGIEYYSGGDFNDYYHTTQDLLQYLNMPYYVEFVKASIATFAHMSGCLIPSGLGYLDGTVTAQSGGAPVEGATVTMLDPAGHTFSTTTNASGYYTQALLADTYTVTAEAYSYLPVTVTGVTVMTGSVTTQDFALPSAPTYVVSGTVIEQGSGDPLFAQVEFQGSPETVWTDPGTGYYQASLPQGEYTMQVTASLHRPEERPIVLDHDQTQDFALEPLPCILLVDDDNNSPDVLPYYTASLDNLGYDYDVFDVGGGGGNGPNLTGLEGYSIVVWFSGDKYGGSAGPNGTDETHLAAYLDGGGKLFLSSQDYLYDFGLTTFGQNYLGIGSYTNDGGGATTKYGVAGDPIGGGLGPYPLSYPSGFTDYGDIVNAGSGASVAFRSSSGGGNNLDVDKDGGAWQTVFFGTSWVPIYNNNAANGEEVLQRIVDWFGGCVSQDGWLTGQVTDALSGDPLAGAQVTVQPSSRAVIQTITDPNGRYTMTLPADTYDATAAMTGYYPQTATGIEVQVGMTTTQDFALQPMPAIVVEPLSLEATLYPGEIDTQTLWVTNTGGAVLAYTLHEAGPPMSGQTRLPPAGATSRPRSEPVVDAGVWSQLEAEGQSRALIYLREQADLSSAGTNDDWAERGQAVYERLHETAERSGGELRALLETAGAQPRVLLAVNAIAATVDAPLLEAVASRPEVAHIGPNQILSIPSLIPGEGSIAAETVEWNIAQIGADQAWTSLGITGDGVTVGIVDSGVLYTHGALVEAYRGNLGGGSFDHNYDWFDFVAGQPEPYDDVGHGTFATGIVVGDEGGVNQIGVAPGAEWIAVKTDFSIEQLHAALDWMLAPTDLGGGNANPAMRPQVGLGPWNGIGCDTEFQPDLQAWRAAGIVPIFRSGSNGPACSTLGSPGDLPEAFTASATDASDNISSPSSRGPSCWSEVKPEVAAPGVNIRSSSNAGDYQIGSGTSWSVAHLAGAAALVLSADPSLSPDEVEYTIEQTAMPRPDGQCGDPGPPNNVYGWGRIDAFEAVSLTLAGLTYDIPWLSVEPVSGTLDPGQDVAIAVTFDAGNLAAGTYTGMLDVESSDPVSPHVRVAVTLTVLSMCEPVQIEGVVPEIEECVVSFCAELTGTSPYSFTWDFGSIGSSTQPTPTVDFGVSGTYPYTLTVRNCGEICSDWAAGEITVACEPTEHFYVYLPIVVRRE